MDALRDEGALIGVAGHPEAAGLAALGLHAMQHRGGGGAGVVASDGFTLRAHRGPGPVAEACGGAALQSLSGRLAVGHLGRPGGVSSAPEQPMLARARGGAVALAMVGRFTTGQKLRQELQELGALLVTATDAELLLHLFARSSQRTFVNRLVDALWRVEGAYALVGCTEDRLVAIRDPRGFRPLIVGRRGAALVVATEEAALIRCEAQPLRELEPGELLVVDPEGARSVAPFPSRPRAACLQERLVLTGDDGRAFGRSAYEVRFALGERLAADHPTPQADLVIPLGQRAAALAGGFARVARLPVASALLPAGLPPGLVKPGDQRADPAVWSVVAGAVRARRVVLVGPGLGDGADVRRAVQRLREAGAAQVHARLASPPLRSGCPYGVAGPDGDALLLAQVGVDGLADALRVDTFGALSLDAVHTVAGAGAERGGFCDGCLGGRWPLVPDEPADQLPLFEGEA